MNRKCGYEKLLGVVILRVGVGCTPSPELFFGKNRYFSHFSLDFDLPRQKKVGGRPPGLPGALRATDFLPHQFYFRFGGRAPRKIFFWPPITQNHLDRFRCFSAQWSVLLTFWDPPNLAKINRGSFEKLGKNQILKITPLILTPLECPYKNFYWDQICRGQRPLTNVEESVRISAPVTEILGIKNLGQFWVKIWGPIKKNFVVKLSPNFVYGHPLRRSLSVQKDFPQSFPKPEKLGKNQIIYIYIYIYGLGRFRQIWPLTLALSPGSTP